ncbi:MAG: nucleoside monophosphate kinase [Deltaproteobacteria bacterium]|nr:nucleoside monophosphate kinase [Deltaproteobacteria bacterium]
MNLIFLGPPGAGKGTQTKKLIEEFGFIHLSTGDILRQLIRSRDTLGLQAQIYMDQGKLVPDGLILEMIQTKMEKKCGYIFDGFPRTIDQASALDKIVPVDHVVYLFLSHDVILKRLTGRRVCEKCGKEYHIEFMPSSLKDSCELCKGRLYQREDDRPFVIENRLSVYEKQTKPLLEYYHEKLIRIEACGNVLSIDQENIKKIGLSTHKAMSQCCS